MPTGRYPWITEEDFWKRKRLAGNDCWEYTGCLTRDGYGTACYKGKGWLAHRLAWTFVKGTIPKNKLILHHCDNPPCINPKHLFCGTQIDNMADMKAKGRRKGINAGTKNGRAKINRKTADHIRKLYANGGTCWKHSNLASRFKISQSLVSLILLNRIWN